MPRPAFAEARGGRMSALPDAMDSRRNSLLAAWAEQLAFIPLQLGQVLYEAGRPPSQVYFLTTAIVSLPAWNRRRGVRRDGRGGRWCPAS